MRCTVEYDRASSSSIAAIDIVVDFLLRGVGQRDIHIAYLQTDQSAFAHQNSPHLGFVDILSNADKRCDQMHAHKSFVDKINILRNRKSDFVDFLKLLPLLRLPFIFWTTVGTLQTRSCCYYRLLEWLNCRFFVRYCCFKIARGGGPPDSPP